MLLTIAVTAKFVNMESNQNNLFIQWFEYDLYANKRVLKVIENNVGALPDDTLKLFSHIIAAHEIWNSRIEKRQRRFKVWERIPVTEMESCLIKNFEDTVGIIKKPDIQVQYETTERLKFSNQISDILFHVLTHNHYHRGQIARNMRENGIDPAETNYIVYRR